MSQLREYLEAIDRHFPGNAPTAFLLKHGRDYPIGPHSYALPRMVQKQCYQNATLLTLDFPHLTYVEGKISCHGVPLDHAWCIDEEGVVVDPTIDNSDGHITDYFGVPFRTDYLHRAVTRNRVYGLLDYYYARKTAPKLYELGLEAGQDWLLNKRRTLA
jgi:hypothetical protein